MKTKFYQVCRSGPTIDSREITPEQIDQMAESYNPKTYGARVWCEHLRSLMPKDSPFRAYGDVLAVKAKTDEEGHRVLLAQVEATDELVKLNRDRQKVYWSVEVDPNFAGSGKAYLCGLAVTDTPASLGTEIIKLSQTHRGQITGGDKIPAHLYSQGVEGTALDAETEQSATTQPESPSLLSRVKDILNGNKASDDARFTQIEETVTVLASGLSEIKTALNSTDANKADTAKTEQPESTASRDEGPVTRAEFNALLAKLSDTPAAPGRPPHTGNAANAATDC